MRILHFLGSFLNGGIETLLVNVANHQVGQGHEVAIMVGTKWDVGMLDLLDKRIKVFLINKPIGSHNPFFSFKILYYYHKYQADIFHLHGPKSALKFRPKNRNERRIVTIHNETIKIPFSSTVDQYIAISQCVKESFVLQTGHDNCVVCYNGIDVDKFVTKQNYADKPYRLLALGRVVFSVKAQDVIVQAFGKLPYCIREQMILDVWGDGQDMEELKNIVGKLGLENQVTLKGNVSNSYVAEHLCDYDMLICASHHEGLGISAIEAMAAGVPVLLSDALGFREVTENGKYGSHFAHADVNALTTSIECAFNDYTTMCFRAKEAIAYSRKKFSINNYVNTISQIYSLDDFEKNI